MKNLSSAVRLTSTLSMLPVLLLSKDKSSSGGTPGSKKSWPVINYEIFELVATLTLSGLSFPNSRKCSYFRENAWSMS